MFYRVLSNDMVMIYVNLLVVLLLGQFVLVIFDGVVKYMVQYLMYSVF